MDVNISHLSHSSREALERCARQFFLSRIAKAPQRPALWLAGGSAVHEATEFYDLYSIAGKQEMLTFNAACTWEACFGNQLSEARAKEPNENAWRRSQSEPIEVWNSLGPQFVQSYIDWRERSPWEIWTTPDGQPAIELDVSGKLPGCPVEIKGFVDRVFWDPVMKRLIVLDLKSGKRAPSSPAQFETYAALIAVKYDIQAELGVPFMNRKGTVGKPFDLSEVEPEAVGKVYGKAWADIQEYARTGSWPADTSDCYLCDVSASCYAKGGPLSARYDPAHPEYVPY